VSICTRRLAAGLSDRQCTFMICPKCSFNQDDEIECLRCGVIFIRYHGEGRPPVQEASPASSPDATPTHPSLFRRTYRIIRWVGLAGILLVLILVLRTSPLPRIPVSPQAVESARVRVQEFQAATQEGRESTLHLDKAELNGWLGTNLALQPQVPASKVPMDLSGAAEPTVEEVQSNVKDVKIDLLDESLRAYVLFDFHGKELSLEIDGKLLAQDGYLRLIPTGGMLGSLPLPQSTLENATRRLFDSPENREKFRLPDHIRDVRIERGELIFTSK
jgi:hypothetical protein